MEEVLFTYTDFRMLYTFWLLVIITHNVFVLWLVALAGTKLIKETEPLENSAGIFRLRTD